MESFVCNEENIEKELSLDKIYNFPEGITHMIYKEYFIIIHPYVASWIITDKNGYDIFQYLSNNHSINDCFEIFEEDDVIELITQIEAKQFDILEKKHNNEINMYIYLTNNCNLRCKHCYMYSGDIEMDILPVEIWKRVIKEFFENGGTGITFTGGEVLLYKDFLELLKYSHELGIRNTVLSNGILWDEEKIKNNKDYIDEMQISLDGYDKDSYYSVRQFDGFEKVISVIELLEKYNINTSVAVTPVFEDIDEFILNFERFAKSFIEKNNIWIKINLELLEGRNVKLSENENEQYRKKLKDLVERLYPNFYESSFVLNFIDSNFKTNCGFGGITIASNGDLYWCNQIFKLNSCYNVKTKSMKEIMKLSEEIKEKTSVNNSKICKKCNLKYICGGGCRLKYNEIKDADSYEGMWEHNCNIEYKNKLIEKMINCNEYFFVE